VSAGTDEHDATRLLLGAYLLGGLPGDERRAVDDHITRCATCREELSRLAVVPGLLRRALDVGAIAPWSRPESGTTPSEPADVGIWPDLIAAARGERAAARRSVRRWQVATGAAAAGGVLAVAAAVAGPAAPPSTDAPVAAPGAAATGSPGSATPPTGVRSSLSPASPTDARGDVVLERKAWGTAVALELRSMPAGQSAVAWAISRDGRREQAAAWGPTPSGNARVQGATSIPYADLSRLVVTTGSGTPLLVTAMPARA
jgi:hypothetical protein